MFKVSSALSCQCVIVIIYRRLGDFEGKTRFDNGLESDFGGTTA